MDQAQAKQQIVERVKQATNILVTVSNNPSVDQLAACIGLTLLLNRLNKHATAIFSGKIPSTLEFLQPEKTIEVNTDSLQDFIISLDKNKADKLRYKVEDQVVRIFISPYKTSISEKDLVFSHGDFNVEVVMALGIKDRTQIDKAIAAHGRILHDATVVSVNASTGNPPQLGQLNWQDPNASSLCEMLVSISEAFGAGLLDNQMATAFLTGIVAETDRFSNKRTSPKVMTIAAQLMAAGANQQLIVSKLEPAAPPPDKSPPDKPSSEQPKAPSAKKDGSLSVSHGKDKSDNEVEISPNEIRIDRQGNLSAPKDAKTATGEPTASASLEPSNTPQNHALISPDNRPPSMSSPFSADMQSNWMNPDDNLSIDPLSDDSSSDRANQHRQAANSSASADDVDSARDAVQSALVSTPFDPAADGPVAALNAQPIGPDLHASTDDDDITPSLDLPPNGNGSIGTVIPPSSPSDTSEPAAPPPVPPPLPLNSNPGAMLPNTPSKSSDK
jgi:hypothetical protein